MLITCRKSIIKFWYIQIEITVSYSESTFGYIQLFPVSAAKVFVGMDIKENEKYR